jgi:predicted Zn finger-like uncharacterized protein
MPLEINCPACSAKLRVGDDKLGKKVRCPKCKEIFTAEEEVDQVEVIDDLPDAPLEEEAASEQDVDEQDDPRPLRKKKRRRSAASTALSAPATAMQVLAYVGLGLNVLGFLAVLGLQLRQPSAYQFGSACGSFIFLAVWTYYWYNGVMHAANCMSKLRDYKGATNGCYYAMFPCCGWAWLIGLPIGIWSLIVLSKKEVKEAFPS